MLILGVEDPRGRDALHRRRVPERVRQDQPRHAGPAEGDAGLEGLDGRRRHRLDASRRRRPAVGDQPGGRLLRRRAGHEHARPTRTRWTTIQQQHDLHQRRAAARRHACGGRGTTIRRRPRACSTGRAGRGRRQVDREGRASRTAASPRRRRSARRSRPSGDNPKGVPIGAILFGARRQRRVPLVYEARQLAARRLPRRDAVVGDAPRPRPARSACCAATPMAMLPFCGYNMGDYFEHWLDVGKQAQQAAARSSTSTGSAPTRTASSSGRASATTCAC